MFNPVLQGNTIIPTFQLKKPGLRDEVRISNVLKTTNLATVMDEMQTQIFGFLGHTLLYFMTDLAVQV